MATANFFRLAPPAGGGDLVPEDLDAWLRSSPLAAKVRAGDHLFVGDFNEALQLGEVRWIGRVMAEAPNLSCTWQPSDLDLRPNPSGRRYWRTPSFRFADNVAQRYMLGGICAEVFDGVEMSERPIRPARESTSSRQVTEVRDGDDPGYVYVIRSQYGFKIGKSRRLQDRVKLFSVKLPFPISVEMTGWFSDYSAAERRFHRLFHHKRLEGEWFDLENEDLAVLRQALAECKQPGQ